MLHSNINDFFGSEILWNFELDSSRPRHLTSLRLYYIQGLRFGQSIEPCGMTSCSPPCSLVRCCVFLMGPMASATVVDFGISTSGNILLDIIWWYTVHVMYMYIYISYTYKETATLDISDFWYKYTIYIYQYVCIYIYIQSYTLYYSVILYIYIYMLSDTSQHMFCFPAKLVGSKECSQTGNQVKQPYTMAIHGCLSLSAQALGCWCWNAKAVAEVGGACDVEIVKFLCPKWMELVGKLRFESFGVWRCPFSAPTWGHYRYRPSSIWRRPGIKRGFECPELTRWIFVESQRRKTRQACVCKMITPVVLSTSAMSNPQT